MSLIVKQEQKSYIVDPTGSHAPSATPISLPQEVLPYENTPSFLTPPTGEATPPGSPKNSPGKYTDCHNWYKYSHYTIYSVLIVQCKCTEI